jgi:xanthine dehydrogenase accessory factor
VTDLVDVISGLLRNGEDIVLARVISVKGSSPRDVGATMVIRRNGEIAGTVGGGLIEAAAMQKALGLFEAKGFATLAFDMTGDDLKTSDMVCGGKTELLLELLPASDEMVRIFDDIKNNMRNSKACFLITGVPCPDGAAGPMGHWLLSDGNLGTCGGNGLSGLPAALKDEVGSLLRSALIELDQKRFWVDIIRNNGVIYIFGAGHVGREVSDLALRCGFRTVVLDDRDEFANQYRFKVPAEVVVLKSFQTCFDGLRMDENSYVVIVTRGHKYDKLVLQQALKTGAGYVGMIGSVRKRDAIYKSLMEEGFSARQLEKVRCPVGLKMEAETPAEIAVSIVGELINVRAEKRKWAEVKS